jgi:hypothetical protein
LPERILVRRCGLAQRPGLSGSERVVPLTHSRSVLPGDAATWIRPSPWGRVAAGSAAAG